MGKAGLSKALADGQPGDYVGLSKVAVFMLAIGPEAAGMLMRHMNRETVEDLTREIASLGVVLPEKSEAIVEEFYTIALAKQYAAEGG